MTSSHAVIAFSFALLAAVAIAPSATAVSDWVPPCPDLLPLWDAAMCWGERARYAALWTYEFVTCDVVGGPACGGGVICTELICLA